MTTEPAQIGTDQSYPPVEVAPETGLRALLASNPLLHVTDEPSEALEGEIVDDTKGHVQTLITAMHRVGKRYPFNLLLARWRLHPVAWSAIRRYHNPETVWITDSAEGPSIWGVPVVLDDHSLAAWEFELVCRGTT